MLLNRYPLINEDISAIQLVWLFFMPLFSVILTDSMQDGWISFKLNPPDVQDPFPSNLMESWTVSRLFNSREPSANSPDAIRPFEYPELAIVDGFGL